MNKKKMKALILEVTRAYQKKRNFDLTALFSVIFQIDMKAFGKLGKSITGATYIKRKWGVEPKGIDKVLKEMLKEGSIELVQKKPKKRRKK